MNKETCSTCVYYAGGSCHRYPETIVKRKSDWCGEYRKENKYDTTITYNRPLEVSTVLL